MQTDTVTIEGVEYVNPSACVFGDYGGAGSVGLANIRAILEQAGESVFATGFSEIRRASESVEPGHYAMDSEMELRAAVKADRPLVIHVTGAWSSETVYMRADSDLARDTLESLESYSSLDDESVSNIEMEWESEAWESWLRSDLERAAWPADHEPADEAQAVAYDAMSDADKFEAYRHAMEVENCYPEAEYNGVAVNVSHIAKTYRQTVESLLAGETVDSLSRKRWPAAYGISA